MPWRISIHALREEGDTTGAAVPLEAEISIHALREEGDRADAGHRLSEGRFLSTPSARRATVVSFLTVTFSKFLSTPSARRATSAVARFVPFVKKFLSTPSARRATQAFSGLLWLELFLSTPSARRATSEIPKSLCPAFNFYPRPPRGGRPDCHTARFDRERISIHALREEGDPPARPAPSGLSGFLSTPSARRATRRNRPAVLQVHDFYPRPPRGGRLGLRYEGNSAKVFLSTPSARRATNPIAYKTADPAISIHALREEDDGQW